jgi:pilus assembly protein CpaE
VRVDGDLISVLIVDDSALMCRVLTDIVGSERDMEVAASASGGREAVELATDLQPDIILMDVHMPDLDGVQATWLLANRAPHGAVIVVTAEQRPDVLERARVAGAQAIVHKPLGHGGELIRTIREVHGRSEAAQLERGADAPSLTAVAPASGRRIAVFGAKGGVGKTTVAVGLALALRKQRGASVALFDADYLFGDTNIQLNLRTQPSIINLLPYQEALDSTVVSRAMQQHVSGLDVLVRPPRPEQAETISPDHVRAILGVLATLYDYVIVDTQPTYDERMLSILDLADVYLIVLAPQLSALQNLAHFLRVATVLGYPFERMCFVLNRANVYAGLTIDRIASVVGTDQIIQIPDGGTAVVEALNLGDPMTLRDPKSPFARAIAALAEEVRTMAEETKHLPA